MYPKRGRARCVTLLRNGFALLHAGNAQVGQFLYRCRREALRRQILVGIPTALDGFG